MNGRILRILCAAAAAAGCFAAPGCRALPQKTAEHANPADAADAVPDSVYGRAAFVGAVMDFVSKNYVDPEKSSVDKLMTGALRGMLQELDPYSTYIPPDGAAARQTPLTGENVGVGITVSHVRQQGLLVVGVIPGSPAALAGIRPGDLVLEVDGQRLQNRDLEDMLASLRGKPGSEILLTIRAAGKENEVLHRLTRKAFVISPVPFQAVRFLPGGIGYIRLTRFNRHTGSGLQAAVRQLEAKGQLRGLILDLRNNPGGMVDAAVETVSCFLPEGQAVFTAEGRQSGRTEVRRTLAGKQFLTGIPLAVLVNEFSASASEITAGALKDHKRAVIVGGKTFGKGAIQEVRSLPNGGALRYTRAYYRTPGGHKIDGIGVVPDIPVNVSRQETLQIARAWQKPEQQQPEDRVLVRAVKWMQEKLHNEQQL